MPPAIEPETPTSGGDPAGQPDPTLGSTAGPTPGLTPGPTPGLTPTPNARRRLGRAFLARRPTPWSLVVPLVAVVAGLLFATSFQTAQGTDLRSAGQDLPDLIRAANRQVQTKAENLRQLQVQVDGLTAAAAPGSGEVRTLTDRAAALAAPVGVAAVHGPAVTVTLDDAHRSADSLPAPYGPDDIVVHQQDVQGVVNALWAGGAEAMMIQDQRVVATSAVRCVGNTLILQGRVYSPPYVISAIGPTGDMQTALARDPQVAIYREWVDAVGLTYDLRVAGQASFPAYAGPVTEQTAVVSP